MKRLMVVSALALLLLLLGAGTSFIARAETGPATTPQISTLAPITGTLASAQTPLGSASPLTNVDWAIGATSSTTGLSTQAVDWINLASSYSTTGVSLAAFEDNAPFTGDGSFSCGANDYTITGFVFQIAVAYSGGYDYDYPDFAVIVQESQAPSSALYYSGYWSTDLGSGPITETLAYTTYDSITGRWAELTTSSSTYYLMSISTADGISFYTTPTPTDISGCTMGSITSVGTSTSTLTETSTIVYEPSIGFEVNEATSGDFLSDNSNLGVNANVTSSADLFTSAYGTVKDFDIGGGATPPSTAYLSGMDYQTNIDYHATYYYYDLFGTNSGIQNYIDNQWYVSGASTTQSSGIDLRTENSLCSGDTCPLVRL
ncbi:MAG: hypothetical protein JRN09_06785 [Nitrososphaerota archaeon]|nr:hypothetical protein [Nitrososphaerota archaeon]